MPRLLEIGSLARTWRGTWSWEIYSLHGTRNFATDGSFAEQTVFKGTNASQTAGTWHVKDGRVIVSVTNDSTKRREFLELLACRLFA